GFVKSFRRGGGNPFYGAFYGLAFQQVAPVQHLLRLLVEPPDVCVFFHYIMLFGRMHRCICALIFIFQEQRGFRCLRQAYPLSAVSFLVASGASATKKGCRCDRGYIPRHFSFRSLVIARNEAILQFSIPHRFYKNAFRRSLHSRPCLVPSSVYVHVPT